eukprot:gb/GECG01012371.1/.p1 GENE.gb/GECG01012371.1/~~gb/GECG01012371.1/.p1  ORF type:complete len:789 (+),score=159.65 gb/GECG01012371.1/:1-2367(+)
MYEVARVNTQEQAAMSNGAGEEASPPEEYDFEIDLSSFAQNTSENGGNVDDKYSSVAVADVDASQYNQKPGGKAPGTDDEPPPPPPRPKSSTPTGIQGNGSDPRPASVDANVSPTGSSSHQRQRRSSKSVAEWRQDASRRNSERVAPPPSNLRSDSANNRTRRSTMSPLLRGAPKPPLPAAEPMQRSKSTGSAADGDEKSPLRMKPEALESNTNIEATPVEDTAVLMPTVSTKPAAGYGVHSETAQQRSEEDKAVAELESVAIGERDGGSGAIHTESGSRRAPGGEQNPVGDDNKSQGRPASVSNNSDKLSRSAPRSPQSPRGSGSGGPNSDQDTPPTRKVSVQEFQSRVEKWHQSRAEQLRKQQKMREQREKEDQQHSFTPNLKLTEEANKKLVSHQGVPFKRLHDWGQQKEAQLKEQRQREAARKMEEESDWERLQLQNQGTPLNSGTTREQEKRAVEEEAGGGALPKKSRRKKQNVSPQLKERQQAQLEAFLERQKKAREQAEFKKKVPFATGENYTGKITKPKEFKLSYLNRATEKEKDTQQQMSTDKQSSVKSRNKSKRPTSRGVVSSSSPTQGKHNVRSRGQKKVSSPPSNSGAAWARFAGEVPVSLSADPEFVEAKPTLTASSGYESKQGYNEDESKQVSVSSPEKDTSEADTAAAKQQDGPSLSKRVGFTEGSLQEPANPLSASQSEKLEKRPPTPHPSQSFAPPTPGPPKPTASSERASTMERPTETGRTDMHSKSYALDSKTTSASLSTDDEELSLETLREEIRRVREELQREKEEDD